MYSIEANRLSRAGQSASRVKAAWNYLLLLVLAFSFATVLRIPFSLIETTQTHLFK